MEREAGIDAHITKPIDVWELMQTLAEVLDCPTEYLLSEQPGIISGIYEKFGKDRSYISKNLLLDIEAYFSCDYISQEEKDTLMFAIHESYIQSRKNNSNSWKKIKARYIVLRGFFVMENQ